MSGIKIHERSLPVAKSLNELTLYVLTFQSDHGLTEGEMLSFYADRARAIGTRMVRLERHGDASKKGDEA